MVEIRIESRARLWPWMLLGVVLLVLIAWWLHTRREREVVTETRDGTVIDTVPATAAGTVEGMPTRVNDFLHFVAESQVHVGSALTHQFTADGVRHLAAALGAMSEADSVGGVALRPQLDAMRERAEALERDERPTDHADYARDAFERAASLMEALRFRQYPNVADQVREVRQAAEMVRPDRGLVEQSRGIRRFFDRAAVALRDMANTQGAPGVSN